MLGEERFARGVVVLLVWALGATAVTLAVARFVYGAPVPLSDFVALLAAPAGFVVAWAIVMSPMVLILSILGRAASWLEARRPRDGS